MNYFRAKRALYNKFYASPRKNKKKENFVKNIDFLQNYV